MGCRRLPAPGQSSLPEQLCYPKLVGKGLGLGLFCVLPVQSVPGVGAIRCRRLLRRTFGPAGDWRVARPPAAVPPWASRDHAAPGITFCASRFFVISMWFCSPLTPPSPSLPSLQALPTLSTVKPGSTMGPKVGQLEDEAECSIADGTCVMCAHSHQPFDRQRPNLHHCCSRMTRKWLCNSNTPRVCCDGYQTQRTEEMKGRDTIFWCTCQKQSPGFAPMPPMPETNETAINFDFLANRTVVPPEAV